MLFMQRMLHWVNKSTRSNIIFERDTIFLCKYHYNKRCKPVLMMWPKSSRANLWRHSCSQYIASVAQAWHYTFPLSWPLAIAVAKQWQGCHSSPPSKLPTGWDICGLSIFWLAMLHHTWPWPLVTPGPSQLLQNIRGESRGHPGAFICGLTS